MKYALLSALLLLLCPACKRKPEPAFESRSRMSENAFAYCGEEFRLSHPATQYASYDDAVEDMPPEELERLEAKLLSAPIAQEFSTKIEMAQAAIPLMIPGGGLGGLDSAGNIATVTLGIPKRDAARYITGLEKNGRWSVVDDFKGPIPAVGTSVKIENGELIYTSYQKVVFRRKQLE